MHACIRVFIKQATTTTQGKINEHTIDCWKATTTSSLRGISLSFLGTVQAAHAYRTYLLRKMIENTERTKKHDTWNTHVGTWPHGREVKSSETLIDTLDRRKLYVDDKKHNDTYMGSKKQTPEALTGKFALPLPKTTRQIYIFKTRRDIQDKIHKIR